MGGGSGGEAGGEGAEADLKREVLLRAIAAGGEIDTLTLIDSFPPRAVWLTDWMRSRGWNDGADFVTRILRPPIIGTSLQLWALEEDGLLTSERREQDGYRPTFWRLTDTGQRYLEKRNG